jgi:hypothetical protein
MMIVVGGWLLIVVGCRRHVESPHSRCRRPISPPTAWIQWLDATSEKGRAATFAAFLLTHKLVAAEQITLTWTVFIIRRIFYTPSPKRSAVSRAHPIADRLSDATSDL